MAKREFECKVCGATVESYGGYDTQCGRCGQEYNAFGQMLREGWQDNPSWGDDEIGDMEGYEMSLAWDK